MCHLLTCTSFQKVKKKIEGASCKIGLRVEFKIKVKVYDWYLICNPPFDTPTCMWKFQSISESSQPKNWMSAVNTRKMLSCIYHVFLSFSGEGDQRLLHQVVTLLLKSVIVDIPRLVGMDSAREPPLASFSWWHYMLVLHEYTTVKEDVPGITKWPLLNSRTSFMHSVESAKPGLYIQRDLPSQDHLVFRQERIFLFLFIFLWEWERITLMALGDFTFKT